MTFKCPRCLKQFPKRPAFTQHVKKKHPSESEDILQATDGRRKNDASPFLCLLLHWRCLPSWHPQLEHGIAVLQYLIQQQIPLSEPLSTNIMDSFKVEPTIVHLEQDLRATESPGIIATGTGTGAPHLTPAHLTASLRVMDSRRLMNLSPAQLCAGNNIYPTAEGLQQCQPFHADWRQDYGAHPYLELQASTAYCPRGHITDIHQDSLFEGRFTTVLFGRKLFLTWPPTDQNLAVYEEIHGHFTGFVLPALLPRLEGLQATLHSHGSVGFMPPGTIHSVLNLDTAATFAYDVIHRNMFEDILRLCKWERSVSQRLTSSGDTTDTVASIAAEHGEGMNLWETMASRSTDKTLHAFVRNLRTLQST